ncbi:2,6-dihydropseudooxynicotine hydrolase [Talaromyces proteolyticus]|uniref:2,6-dihydropseudooxynicotine hydrolase n=1 Tax=Talaromyces proteolyticus TaxID=1131652 RepID=A0AAD4KRK5_9EURO|nr:2,6-dihydropseudooxynicotine hydrolase [Talaromyces proteolyticus]KAH8698855.1 2,6-dihydropseudooxynicotine hydrolase [Talaromyces proteolyticus]
MYQLSSDPDFHFEILRVLALAPYEGSDIGEVLIAANQILPKNMESYSGAFNALADRVQNVSNAIDVTKHPISARNAFFRASSYYRSADFFLHGNWSDPRIYSLWDQQLAAFNSAIALLPTPGERVVLKGNGFDIPIVFYGSGLPGPRPTLILCNGYDGSQEEMYHFVGQAVVQRGWNAITYEGPGQPTVRREQNLGFIPQWEQVVTPVVDYALTRPEVDPVAIGSVGLSFGGWLAPRAAVYEHRLAATLAVDGLYDFGPFMLNKFGPEMTALFNSGNATAFNDIMYHILEDPSTSTSTRWGIQQGLWAFDAATPFEWVSKMQNFNLEGLTQNITMPVFVASAQNDLFFPGQAQALAAHLIDVTYHAFTNEEGAGEHCSTGADVLQNQVMLDWFQHIIETIEG